MTQSMSQPPRDGDIAFLREAITIAGRINEALGHTDLSPTALLGEVVDMYALQQLALRYAEQVLDHADWIRLAQYIAHLGVVEGAISTWQWTGSDLMAFALGDYLADCPDAGDALLHETARLIRQGATRRFAETYRRSGIDTLRLACEAYERGEAGDGLCVALVSARSTGKTKPTLN